MVALSSPAKDSGRMIPLVTLVRRRLDEMGNPKLRPLVQSAGLPQLYGTLQRYQDPATPPLKSGLRKETIKNLARVLQVPVSEVEAAERDSMDRVRQSEEPSLASIAPSLSLEDAIRRDPTLLPEARAHLLNQVQLLRRLGAADDAAEQRRLEAVAQEAADRARLTEEDRGELRRVAQETQSSNPPVRLDEKRPGRRVR